jgi:hypothetical protein
MTAAIATVGLGLLVAGITGDEPVPALWVPGAALIVGTFLWGLSYPARVNRRRRNRRGGWIR